MQTEHGKTLYLNSGDWIENLTALEYNNKKWKLHQHIEDQSDFDEELQFEYENKLGEQFITLLQK